MNLLTVTLLALAACAPEETGKRRSTTDTGSAADTSGDADDTRADDPSDTSADTAWDTSSDTDGDGVLDLDEGRPGGDGPELDTDGDGVPDYRDTDSDGDTVPDGWEARPRASDGALSDADGDGTPDLRDTDSDGDALPDATEASPADGSGTPADTDRDGTPDLRDTDTDGDALPDLDEGSRDSDGDGLPNWRDPRNDGSLAPIRFFAISTPFNSPIGIDFHEPTATVVMSVNYDRGGLPQVLERVNADGTHTPFSTLSGLTDEVKIATARSDNPGGFETGSLYVGNGIDGQIVRVSADGAVIDNPWVDLPGTGNGLMRGSMYVDRTGAWGGDLVVATTEGELWRVTRDGVPTFVADVNAHLEGLAVVPDAPARYGPLAGRALAGAENEGLLYAFGTDGTFDVYNLGVRVEDVDIANPYENFFGVNYGTSRVIGAYASAFAAMTGDILLTQEGGSTLQLYRLRWDGSAIGVEVLQATADSPTFGSWEHVTFARAGIQEVGIAGR